MNPDIAAGIDIGGSHITVGLIDLRAHSLIRDTLIRRHINSQANADEIIKEWTEAITTCKNCIPDSSERIGIAMPGPFDYEKGISFIKGQDKYESLYNINVKELLAKKLDIDESDIFMMNDASCFLKGEVFAGAAIDRNNVIGLTLGTGLGSAIFKDDVIYDGDLFYAPYKEGVAEDYLSTRWFIKRYKELTGITPKNVKEIKERIPGDETASSLFIEFGKNLGEGLAVFIEKHKAETVVIGGNIINAWELFIPETKKVLNNYAINVSLVKAALGEEAALLGAGSLCI